MQNRFYGYTPEEYTVFRREGRRYMVWFSILYMMLYCCRLNLSAASAVMMEGLSWDKSRIGILTSCLFWCYGIGQPVSGRLSEVLGPGRFVILSVIASAILNLLMSLQTAFLPMAVLWSLNGFAQAMAWAPGILMLTGWFPRGRAGFATGFVHAFSGFGQAMATLAVTLGFAVLPALGWRSAFIVPAVFPVIALILYLLLCRESPARAGLAPYTDDTAPDASADSQATSGKGLAPFLSLLKNPRFVLWLVIALLTGLARYGLMTWVPLYFTDRFGVNITDGLLQSLALPVGMGIGTFVLPWLSDRLCPSNRLPLLIAPALIGAAAAVGFFLLDPRSPLQSVLITLLLFIAGFCVYAMNGMVWTCAQDIGGRSLGGTACGMLGFTSYMGAALQSLIFGFALDRGGWAIVFLTVATSIALIAPIAKLAGRR